MAKEIDERGFSPGDYEHTAKLLLSSENIRQAAASNNHNIILAALFRCAGIKLGEEPLGYTQDSALVPSRRGAGDVGEQPQAGEAQTPAQSPREKELEKVLIQARDQFLFYEKNHIDKAERLPPTSDAYIDTLKKANVNRDMAAMCDAALSSAQKEEVSREAELEDALRDITNHFADVMNGPIIRKSGITFANGVEGIPTIARARRLLNRKST